MATSNGPFLSHKPPAHALACSDLARALLLLVTILAEAPTTVALVLVHLGEGAHRARLLLLRI